MATGEQKLDIENPEAHRQVWLIKVPKEVHEAWSNAKETDCVASVRINEADKKKVSLHLDSSFTYPEHVAREFSMDFTDTLNQGMMVLADPLPPNEEGRPRSLRGVVAKRANAIPKLSSAKYRKFLDGSQQQERTKFLDFDDSKQGRIAIHEFKVAGRPVSAGGVKQAKVARDDSSKDKRFRANEDELQAMIFKAFETHQYYTLKNLADRCNQPVAYVKDALKDLCVFHSRGPHKNLYELKPEYQHFKAPEGTVSGTADDDENDVDMGGE